MRGWGSGRGKIISRNPGQGKLHKFDEVHHLGTPKKPNEHEVWQTGKAAWRHSVSQTFKTKYVDSSKRMAQHVGRTFKKISPDPTSKFLARGRRLIFKAVKDEKLSTHLQIVSSNMKNQDDVLSNKQKLTNSLPPKQALWKLLKGV